MAVYVAGGGASVVVPAAGAAEWPTGTWRLPTGVVEADCYVAFQPIGAADLAESYTNVNDPGTGDAAPGTAPTFAGATGWTFNGSSQYLTMAGYVLMPGSVFVRGTLTDFADSRCLVSGGDGTLTFYTQTAGLLQAGKTNLLDYGTSDTGISAGVDTVWGATVDASEITFYVNGVNVGVNPTISVVVFPSTVIGSYGAPTGALLWKGEMAAVALYNRVLTAGEVAELATAMSLL